MDSKDGRKTMMIELRSGWHDSPRRHASIFLLKGRYRLDLVAPPDDDERPEDSYAWTAWSDPGRIRYLNRFVVYSPSFPFNASIQDRRQAFGTGSEYKTKKEAVAGFMALSDDSRTISIDASNPIFGHPAMFFIHDEQDKDNRGGLTIRIVPV
jgi:hypothetical protein